MILLLITNFAVFSFFRYYSVISVTEEEDYSDVIVSMSDVEQRNIADVEIELPEDSVFYNKALLNNYLNI